MALKVANCGATAHLSTNLLLSEPLTTALIVVSPATAGTRKHGILGRRRAETKIRSVRFFLKARSNYLESSGFREEANFQ